MAHDVMISHSHEDKPAADAACAALEARGIRCWIAPRDINPGQDWATSILQAIQDARIMLLVFSRHANQSPQVNREVERAVHSGKTLLPLRIEDVLPEAALEYFLGTPHWLDAITKPFEAHLEKLADACTSLLAVTGRSPQDADQGSAASDPALIVTTLPTEQPSADHRPPMMLWWRRQPRQVRMGLIAAIVVILAVTATVGYLLTGRNSGPSNSSQPSTTAQPTTTSRTVTPVAEAALEGLLLSPDQINSAMGATGMTVTETQTVMTDDSAHVADKACLRVESVADASVYAGSGYITEREQNFKDFTHEVDQAVVLFPSADQAGAFFTASAQQWPGCANRQYTWTQAGQPDTVWTEGPVSNTNGTLSATETRSSGWTCQHALTVANNVAIDVFTCSRNPADSAVNIAHQIAAKVPTT